MQQRFWLMTSRGELYSAREGRDGEHLDYEKFDTGLEGECEFEGLAEVESSNTLALLCKDAKKKRELRVFEWSVDERRLVNDIRSSGPGGCLRPGSLRSLNLMQTAT